MTYAFINSKGEYILEVAEDVYFNATSVAELERERIIKLLESLLEDDITNDSMHYQDLGIRIAIAAVKAEKVEIMQGHIKIKGENK